MNAVLLLALIAAAPKPVEVLERWTGIVGDDAPKPAVEFHDFIADAKTFQAVWKAWRPKEPLPQVDFTRDLILVGIFAGPNAVYLEPIEVDAAGRLTFTVTGTKKAGPGFGYTLLRIARDKIVSVNGKPIARQDERTAIKVVGTVRTGRIVIGGETTGVTITTDTGTYELDSHADAQLAARFKQFDGKRAVVEGRLTVKPGVEVPERRIIEVTRIDAADKNG